MKQIDIITIFPDMFKGPFDYSIVKRAQYNKLITVQTHDLRQWTTNNYQTVDGHPFGGGPGMVMLVEPIYKAVRDIKAQRIGITKVLLTSAKGQLFTQQKAISLNAEVDNLIIICGHYEGVDERVAEYIADEEISIGKYILSGGEIPAMVISDALIRLLPGALGNSDSLNEESFNDEDGLEYPHYTRPATFTTDKGETWSVPEILLSGHHQQITEWKKAQTQHNS